MPRWPGTIAKRGQGKKRKNILCEIGTCFLSATTLTFAIGTGTAANHTVKSENALALYYLVDLPSQITTDFTLAMILTEMLQNVTPLW